MTALTDELRRCRVVILNEGAAGVGGRGKSSLAREFAYRNADRYQVVWWVGGEEPGVLHLGYTQLMTALNLLRQIPDEPPHGILAVREFLGSHGGWLLIVDGLDDLSALRDLLPERIGGHVIVTTLAGASDAPYPVLTVDPLPEADGAAYLIGEFPEVDEPGITALVGYAAGNPLNLRLLAQLAKVTHTNPGELAEHLKARVPDPLKQGATPELSKGMMRIVARLLVEQLGEDDKVARDLFYLCSFLAPHDIPEFLFEVGDSEEEFLSQKLSEALREEARLDALLSRLEEYSLIVRHMDAFTTHEMIQECVRESLSPEARKAWANAATRLVEQAFPYQGRYARPTPVCTRLVPHALACTQFAEEVKVAKEAAAQLLYHTGLYLFGCGALVSAKTCYQLSIALGRNVYGESHPVLATRINSLGIVEHQLGNLQDARECFEKSFAICEHVYGPLHEAVYGAPDENLLTVPIRNLCAILEELGDIDAAQRTYEKAMQIYLEVYGWNHPMVAECADRFGRTWQKLGKLAKARNCYEKSVLAEESAPEPDLGILATYLNNLAIVLMEMNEPTLAHERLSRALRLDKQTHGDRHPSIARDLANLGHACRLMRQWEDAENYYTDALGMIESTEGEDSQHAAALLNHLGVVLLDSGNPSQARTCLDRALTLSEAHFGNESDEVIRTLTNLGRALDELDAHTQAMACYNRALHAVESRQPGHSERQATILYRIGRSLHKQGEYPEAINFLQRAMKIDTQLFGRDHPSVARDAYAVGCALADMDDTVVAMGHLTLALDIYETTLGKNDPRVRKVRRRLELLSP